MQDLRTVSFSLIRTFIYCRRISTGCPTVFGTDWFLRHSAQHARRVRVLEPKSTSMKQCPKLNLPKGPRQHGVDLWIVNLPVWIEFEGS